MFQYYSLNCYALVLSLIASQEPTVTVREARESKSDENQKIKNSAENLCCEIR